MNNALKIACVALAATTWTAKADLVTVNNASLESSINVTWGPDSSNFFRFPEAGRTANGGITTPSLTANDGSAYGIIESGVVSQTPDGGDSMYQTVSLTGGQEYKMTIAVATSSLGNSDAGSTSFSIAIYTSAWGGVSESAYQTLAQDLDTWTDFSHTFIPSATGNYNVGIRNRTNVAATGLGTLYVDNIRLETIPEPATLGLLLATAGAVIIRRRQFN